MRRREGRRPVGAPFAAFAALTVAAALSAPGSAAAQAGPGEPDPHQGMGGGSAPAVFEPPQDTEQQDTTLPPATIAVDLRDADDRPVAGEVVTLGSVDSSVAKGESHHRVQSTTDSQGRALFSHLDTASTIAYRVSAGHEGGSFAAMPFRLDQGKAMHVVLHVYEVTRDIAQAFVLAEMTVAGEIREDRLQLEEVIGVYNLGRNAWQPDDVRLMLPSGYKAMSAQATMSDQGVDEVDGTAKLRGTFPPGRHVVQFQWQLPLPGDSDVDFDVGAAPHVVVARVVTPFASGVQLVADGFPPAEVRRDAQGQRFLVAERKARQGDPKLSVLRIGIHGLPTPGPGRVIATAVAGCGVALGIALPFARRRRETPGGGGQAKARKALLEELAELERARRAGEVGPKTYGRVRAELIDALARVLEGPRA